jgi:hypothetical protein
MLQKLSKLSNRQLGLVLAGSMLVALGVGSGLRLLTSDSVDTATPVVGAVDGEGAIAFESGPFIPSSSSWRLADPSLLKSTPQEARLETIVAGRPDPFAPIVMPAPVSAQRPAAPAAAVATPPVVQDLPVLPVAATQALPPLPTMAPLPNLGPIAAVPPAPPLGGEAFALPQSPVDRLEISGVAQIGDRVSLIVKEPGALTSRYVQAGELLAGGQVRVKRIDISSSEPVVVLEYNGQDFYRSVGSATLAGLF